MSYLAPSTSSLESATRVGQVSISGESQLQSSHTISIHILDDDSLLNVFYLYRPFLGEDKGDSFHLLGGEGKWVRGHWWYKIAHVCRRWRNVVLGSASYLGVSLVCTNGTPVADMLAHSPPLPLVIDYSDADEYGDFTADDEERTILALKQRDRVRRVRLRMDVAKLEKLTEAIDEEYPILECLVIAREIKTLTAATTLPETLQTPHLRHLDLGGFAPPRLLMNTVGLVTLSLFMDYPPAYLHPNTLLQLLSFMPLLETLEIILLLDPFPNVDQVGQPMYTPITISVTLPNLFRFRFRGISCYLEAVLCRIAAPRLSTLYIDYFWKPVFSVPSLLWFINTTKHIRFGSAKIEFSSGQVHVRAFCCRQCQTCSGTGPTGVHLSVNVDCWHLDSQVHAAAQISNFLSPSFSAVKHLAFERGAGSRPCQCEQHDEVDRTEWRKILNSFRNVKTIRIGRRLTEKLSRSLEFDDGDIPPDLLPELQRITYFGIGDTGDGFTSFINARQNAGRPVTLKYLRAKSLKPSAPPTNSG